MMLDVSRENLGSQFELCFLELAYEIYLPFKGSTKKLRECSEHNLDVNKKKCRKSSQMDKQSYNFYDLQCCA